MIKHGFADVSFNEDLSNIMDAIPPDILRLGHEQMLTGSTWRFLTRPIEGCYVGWHIGDLFREGTYGKIYRAERMVVRKREDGLFDVVEGPHEVVIKRVEADGAQLTPDETSAHASEALLHILAWQTMSVVAPWSIPQPYELFGDTKSMSLCMSYVNGRTLYSYFQKTWDAAKREDNTRMFLEIIGQVAFILWHLQERLCMNHRDLKVNNILIRRRAAVTLEMSPSTLTTGYEVTLIDFGFACVGCPTTIMQAGSWFSEKDLCCRAGRDIAHLIFCIHCYFPLGTFLTPAVYAMVVEWMTVTYRGGSVNILQGFTKEGRPRKGKLTYDTGIYEFLRKPEVDPPCDPVTIFRACASTKS